MTKERWAQVKALFYDAIERTPAERAAFVAAATANDEQLRRELGPQPVQQLEDGVVVEQLLLDVLDVRVPDVLLADPLDDLVGERLEDPADEQRPGPVVQRLGGERALLRLPDRVRA